MEFELAKLLDDMDFNEILKVLENLKREDRDAYELLNELVENI